MAALVCAAIAFSGLAVAAHQTPSQLRWAIYFFKPSATLLIAAIAWRRSRILSASSGIAIVVGMLFSTLGDVFLMAPGNYFLQGLASFAVAHVCYLFALTRDVPFAVRWGPFLAYGAIAAGTLVWLWPDVPAPLRLAVVIYSALLAAMAAQAASRSIIMRTSSSLCAALGGAFFLASDSMLAINRFGHRFALASLCVLSTYYLAQLLIALSIDSNHRVTNQ